MSKYQIIDELVKYGYEEDELVGENKQSLHNLLNSIKKLVGFGIKIVEV